MYCSFSNSIRLRAGAVNSSYSVAATILSIDTHHITDIDAESKTKPKRTSDTNNGQKTG